MIPVNSISLPPPPSTMLVQTMIIGTQVNIVRGGGDFGNILIVSDYSELNSMIEATYIIRHSSYTGS